MKKQLLVQRSPPPDLAQEECARWKRNGTKVVRERPNGAEHVAKGHEARGGRWQVDTVRAQHPVSEPPP